MATSLRVLRLFCLGAWVGGLVFFILVAGIAFKYLPDAHLAGIIVRHSLLTLHTIGIGAAVLYILATLALLALRRDTHPLRAIELVLAAIMLALTLYSQFSVIRRMETDRLSLGDRLPSPTSTDPAAIDFNRLHALSVKLESGVLLAGIALLVFAPIHGRGEYRG